jgi:hypothetical protein
MGTLVVDCVVGSLDVENRDALCSNIHCFGLTRSDVAGFCDLHKFWHCASRWFQHTPARWVVNARGRLDVVVKAAESIEIPASVILHNI